MYSPFKFTPATLAEEAFKMQQKLGAGFKTLRDVEDVTYGATDKEAVYTDGRLVLSASRVKAAHHEDALLIVYALVKPPVHCGPAERQVAGAQPARARRRPLPHRCGAIRTARSLPHDGDYIERFIGGCVEFLKHATAWRRSTCSHLPGGAFSAVLRVAASAQRAQPDHHG